MDELYQQALDGTLFSKPSKDVLDVQYQNHLKFPVSVYYVQSNGRLKHFFVLQPGQILLIPDFNDNVKAVVLNLLTGSFVTAFDSPGEYPQHIINNDTLTKPNHIGTVPQPNTQAIIPQNTPRITVAGDVLPNGNYIIREQYWQRMPDSHTLVAGQEETVSVTTTTGKQSTSSTQTDLAISLGMSASAGWGPISSSISASLSASTSTFQQVTVNEQTQVYRSSVLKNDSGATQMYLVWQLTDVVTIFDPNSKAALTSIISVEPPAVIGGPYDPDGLPSPPVMASESWPEGIPLPSLEPSKSTEKPA